MTRGISTILAFLSVLLFPWPLTVALALALALFEPWVPLSLGLFADTLYYTHFAGVLPLATFGAALVTVFAFFVRARLKTSIIRG